MAIYLPTTWVDDDGTDTVGTPVGAATMNNLEQGVLDASTHHKGGPVAERPAASPATENWLWLDPATGISVCLDGEWVDAPSGPPGPAGEDGADGRSAYQVAVDGGFVGTEAEWLASLVGSPGADGADSTVPGPPNELSIGTVTTGAPGSAADAEITGTPPDQALDLTIPRGDTGQGVPAGGAAGQVLGKTSAADYTTGWVTRARVPTRHPLLNVTSLTIPDLNGDTDEAWEIEVFARAIVPGGSRLLTLRPNGLLTNTMAFRAASYAASTGGNSNDPPGYWANSGIFLADWDNQAGSADVLRARAVLWATTGGLRHCQALGGHATSGGRAYWGQYDGLWTDTTTNITSLVLDFGGVTVTTGFVLIKPLGA